MKKNTLGYSEYIEIINEGGLVVDTWKKKENVYDTMGKIAKYTLSNKETPEEREERLIKIASENARIEWEKQLSYPMIFSAKRGNNINLNNQTFSNNNGNSSGATVSVSNPVTPTLKTDYLKEREDAADKDYKEYVRINGNKEDNLVKQKIRSFYGLDNNYVSSYFNKFLRDLPSNFMKAIGL